MRRLIVFLIVVAILLVVADRVACGVAERAIGTKIQSSNHLAQRPNVKVSGFPFFTQALSGRYQRIDASTDDLVADGGLTIDRLDVRLNGVHVALADALHRQVSSAPVDSATADATVGYASINAVAKANLPNDDLKVVFAQGQGDRLSVTGTYHGSLLDAKISAQAQVQIRKGELVVKLASETLDSLPAQVRSQVASLLSGSYKLPALPFGFEAKSVAVGPTGVTVRATATSVNLG
jgi:hypothetical protein